MEIDVDGLAFHYESFGEGRPILMLHGWPGNHLLMTIPLEPLFEGRSGWRRIYPDLPGMGATAGPDWIDDQAGMLRAVLKFMDAVAPNERFATVGVSYGGYLALGVLHERAARLEGLMLWAPMLRHPAKAIVPDHVVFQHDPEIDELLLEEERAWLEISVVHTRANLEAFRASVKPGLMAGDPAFRRRVAQRFDLPFDPLELAEPFERPSLLLAGHQDSATGYADAAALLASFPRATLAVLDRAGHGLAEERHPLFGALVADWLDRMELERA
jgi:pimeloyl-ACP methyl ester carboxylesterase